MINNPYAAYKRQSVTTMTPVEIVIKLYDETERQLNRGIHFIGQKEFAEANKAMTKSYECVKALQSVLDMKVPMSADLDKLYDFFGREILKANMKKDVAVINALLPMLGELKDAFTQISRMPREQILQQEYAQNRMTY
ncbi:MAG: flagellar export chaperone FliS [Eubacterium sp.]|jgi:flagellar protein FliS|nr:flagellar export chaperone FliS [Eubacterium sp.]